MKDHSLYRKRAQALGPAVDRFVLELLNQGQGFIDTRKIWGILSLDKTFEPVAINLACEKAIALDSYSYQMVKGLLKLAPAARRQPLPAGAKQSPSAGAGPARENKFVRPMSVYATELALSAAIDAEQLKLLH